MNNTINEVIAEYKMFVDTLDFEIKGRVLKRIDGDGEFDYSWEVSHYCKPSKDAAGVYIPSLTSAQTKERATELLFNYLNPFTGIDVKPNNYY